jgi:uncharacterized membrane protein YcaP (DUF421 family)
LIGIILGWDYLLNMLGHHSSLFRKFVHPQALKLMENGKFLYRNMRREYITEQEMQAQLRHHGIDDPQQVKAAFMEGDGRISVIGFEKEKQNKEREKKLPHE